MLTGVVSLALIAAAPVPAAKPKPAVTLAEIAAGLRAWRSRIESIHVSVRWTWTPTEGSYSHWVWTRSGKSRLYYKRTVDGVVDESLLAFDGRYTFEFESPEGDPPNRARRVRIGNRRLSPDLLFLAAQAPHLGIVVAGEGKWTWLDRLIDRGKVSFVGTEDSQGRKLPVLELSTGLRCVNGRRRHRITVDPMHGFLPLKHEFCEEIYLTEEFRKVAPPGVWFPVKGSHESWHNGRLQHRMRWEVQSVKLNEQLDEALFHPKIPAGTIIEDHTREQAFRSRPSAGNASSEPEIQQVLVAWLVGIGLAVLCVWLCVRSWKRVW